MGGGYTSNALHIQLVLSTPNAKTPGYITHWVMIVSRLGVSVQNTATIACRDMGFVTGTFRDADVSTPLRPPWLSGIRCAGPEANLTACPRSMFGNTTSCGAVQRLFCITNRTFLTACIVLLLNTVRSHHSIRDMPNPQTPMMPIAPIWHHLLVVGATTCASMATESPW